MSALVFATGPVHLDDDGDDLRADLGAALGEALGTPVVIKAERSYGALLERVLARSVAVAWMPPALFVRAHAKDALAGVLRTERFAGGRYQGAIFVRDGSPIDAPAKLRGARIAWVDRDSCAGYLFPRLALRARGLDPDSCFASESFAESHSRVVDAVATGAVDAGATYVQLADPEQPAKGLAITGWTAFADASSMRAVLVSTSIPSDAVCIGAQLAEPLRTQVRDGLATFHARGKGARLLRAMLGCDRLAIAKPEDYAPVRDALAAEGMV